MLLIAAVVAAYFYVPSPWGFLLVAGAAVVEVAETVFWIRLSRRRRVLVGAETLIGSEGVVTRSCRPDGQVRLAGELWQATCAEGADRGKRVRVVGRDGLVLVVRPAVEPK